MTHIQPKTRGAILEELKRNGEQTAAALSDHLDLTAMAVRLHLYELNDQGLIEFSEQSKGRGRPTKYWKLTKQAQEIFPDAHQALAVDLLSALTQAFGQNGLDKVVTEHSQIQLNSYKKQLVAKKSLASRLTGLAKIRTAEGYMATVHKKDGVWLFSENHCPICAAATVCTKLCANELWVFSQILGADVRIERVEHIISGARRCLYQVTPI